MKLVERKCPNCGADLSFKEDSKTVTCEYCKRTFEIDNNELEQVANEFMVNTFKSFNRMNKFASVFGIVVFVIAIAIILMVLFKFIF